MLEIIRFIESPNLSIADVRCRAEASGCGGEERPKALEIILPRRGVFVFHFHRREQLADTSGIFLVGPLDPYRVSHPVSGGDLCTVLVPGAEILDEAFAARRLMEGPERARSFRLKHVGASPRIQLLSQALCAAGGARAERLLLEELAMETIDAVARRCAASRGSSRESAASPGAHEPRRQVERAKAFLASVGGEPQSLETIGRQARCSPFHLARLFKAATGLTLHQHQTRIRLALALERLAQGEEDLARLAFDLGFSSHSHFSARFRTVFGLTPREVREGLTASGLRRLRKILTASTRGPR